jgi:hypothetical protein
MCHEAFTSAPETPGWVLNMYRITFRGAAIYCETADELSEALRVIEALGGEPAAPTITTGLPTPRQELVTVLKLLKAKGGAGITSSQVAEVVGAGGPQAMSPLLKVWREILEEAGFSEEDVVLRARQRGTTVWRPGPRIAEALKALGA